MAVVQKLRLGLWLRYWAGLRLAPHVGTPAHVAHRMLKLAAVGPGDLVVDLGCGDARLLIAAAEEFGAQGYGVELDPALFAEAQRAVAKENLNHLITVERKDAFSTDLTKATVVTLYLSTKGNARLLPMLREQLPSGARVVSFCWPFEALKPASVVKVDGISLEVQNEHANLLHIVCVGVVDSHQDVHFNAWWPRWKAESQRVGVIRSLSFDTKSSLVDPIFHIGRAGPNLLSLKMALGAHGLLLSGWFESFLDNDEEVHFS